MIETVSVIIPTFNRDWCILEAVKSALNQDCSAQIDVIVVDDGSTDNTFEILENFIEKRSPTKTQITQSQRSLTIIRQENRGVSAARNFGIKQSTGNFIAFLDSDDLWLPNKVSCQIDFFQKNPNAMICQTEEIWVRNGKRVNPKNKHKKLSGMIFEPSLHLCLVSPSAVMMRREFFAIKGLFDENLPACEDYDLWLRTSTDMDIWLVDQPCIIKKGGHQDQLSSNHSLDKYRIESIQNLLSKDILTNEQRQAAIKVLHEKCNIYSNGCLKRGKVNEALYYNSSCLLPRYSNG